MRAKRSTWETIHYHFGLYFIKLTSKVYLKCDIENSFCRGTWGEMTGGTQKLCVRGSHSTFLLNHPLSLPCLLFLIFRAALQYFYQMISPSSSAALMFMKMILCRNASCMPRCHCLSSSLASLFMYKYVCVGGGGIITDWLALFIISWGRVWGSYAKVKFFLQFVILCKCVIAISVWAVTEMLIVWKCTSYHFDKAPVKKERFIEPNDSCLFPTWHQLTLSWQAHTHTYTQTVSLSFSLLFMHTLGKHMALQHMLRY